jgi:prevent-host-death family protein
MEYIINIKDLRASLPDIIKRVHQGDQYVVLYRSRPAFRIMSVEIEQELTLPVSEDPIYGASAVGRSRDGLTAKDHDRILYGKNA